MRSFPSAPSVPPARPSRTHRIGVLVAAAAVFGALAAPNAFAKNDDDDLRHQKNRVTHQVDKARQDLNEASHRVSGATRRLDRAVRDLTYARRHLQTVRDHLQDARALQRRLARRLEQAQERLERVGENLQDAQADVAEQRDLLRSTVLDMESHGTPELAVMGALTSSGSIEELMIAGAAGDMILGREDQALESFESAEDELEDWKAEVREARDAVALQKTRARENLHRIHGFFVDAHDSRVRVRHLVDRARHARKAAVHAKKHDRKALERLKDREARIKRQILALAQKHPGPTYHGATNGLLHVPASGSVTSPFGWRIHPIYGYWGLHDGTDFGAPCGSALWAGESGTVIDEHYDEVYGNRLYLSVGTVNGANLTLVYNHMSSYNVSEGAHVGRGDVVGYVGSTGWSTGCHLHFTVLRNGVAVDPMGYL